MNSAFKWILLAGGAYFLVKATGIQLPSVFAGAPPVSPVTPPPPSGTTTTPPPAAAPLDQATETALIQLAASGDAAAAQASKDRGIKLSADVWNWHRMNKTGVETTADLFTEGNRGELIDAPTYLARRVSAGLNGLGGFTVRRNRGWA